MPFLRGHETQKRFSLLFCLFLFVYLPLCLFSCLFLCLSLCLPLPRGRQRDRPLSLLAQSFPPSFDSNLISYATFLPSSPAYFPNSLTTTPPYSPQSHPLPHLSLSLIHRGFMGMILMKRGSDGWNAFKLILLVVIGNNKCQSDQQSHKPVRAGTPRYS